MNTCLSGDSFLGGRAPSLGWGVGVAERAQRKQWPSPRMCSVLSVQELLGFKVSQRKAVSIQRLRSVKAGLSTGGRAFEDCSANPSDRETPLQTHRAQLTVKETKDRRGSLGASSQPERSPPPRGGLRKCRPLRPCPSSDH